MSYLKANRVARNVYPSSPASVSVPPGYHKILGGVKGREVRRLSSDYPMDHKMVGKMIVSVLPEWSVVDACNDVCTCARYGQQEGMFKEIRM